MALTNPKVSQLSCSECQQWLYDIKTGDPINRGEQKQPRPKGSPTPCFDCPKKSPKEAHLYELTDANLKAANLYYRGRATGWRGFPEWLLSEPLFSRLMALIGRTVKSVEQEKLVESMALVSLQALVGRK